MTAPQPWNPGRRTRVLVGVATLWPPIYFAFFIASIGFAFVSVNQKSAIIPDLFKYIFPLHCFTMLLSFALTAVYVTHAVKNPRLSQEMRLVWIVILFFGNMFAFPVYWWLYLRSSADVPPVT